MTPMKSFLTTEDIIAKRRAIINNERLAAEIARALASDRQEFQLMLQLVGMKDPAFKTRILAGEFDLADDESREQELPFKIEPPRDNKQPQRKSTLVGPKVIAPVPEAPADTRTKFYGTPDEFIAELKKIIRQSHQGISHGGLKQKILETLFADRVTRNNAKSFYKAITALSDDDDYKRHGALFFHKGAYEALKNAGELPVETGSDFRANSSAEIALSVLMDNPSGITAAEAKRLVLDTGKAPMSLTKHDNYIHTMLKSLTGSGYAEKKGNLYFPTEKAKPRANGASGSRA